MEEILASKLVVLLNSMFKASIIETDSVVDLLISEIRISVFQVTWDYKNLYEELIVDHNNDEGFLFDR